MAPKSRKQAEREQQRAAALRERYTSLRCICGRPKGIREPFCKADMRELGAANAPRPMLHGDFDDPRTAEAWQECADLLFKKGFLRAEVTL